MEVRKAVFLDRDGTLIEEVDFLSHVEGLRLFSFTQRALRRLKDAGFLLIVVTNQSGIERGFYTETAMRAIHDELNTRLNGLIDAFYFCPHVPDRGCSCRKPGKGMIDAAGTDFQFDLGSSWVVGDKNLDRELAENIGARSILVRTGYGAEHEIRFGYKENVVDDLAAAVDIILATNTSH